MMIYIDYQLFADLMEEAGEYKNYDMYLAERGWQEWMNPFEDDPKKISDILSCIYAIQHMELPEMRSAAGIMSKAAMSRIYRVPVRTIENWESGCNAFPTYTRLLFMYTVFLRVINGEGRENHD